MVFGSAASREAIPHFLRDGLCLFLAVDRSERFHLGRVMEARRRVYPGGEVCSTRGGRRLNQVEFLARKTSITYYGTTNISSHQPHCGRNTESKPDAQSMPSTTTLRTDSGVFAPEGEHPIRLACCGQHAHPSVYGVLLWSVLVANWTHELGVIFQIRALNP